MKPDISLKNKGGIYRIYNTKNGKSYVGRTMCLYRRCHHYVYDFKNRRSNQINEYLLRSMEKNRLESFEFQVLEFCEIDKMEERELYWMDNFQSYMRDFGYNLRRDSSGCMIVHDLTREKISNRLKSEWASGVRDGHSEKLKKSWEKRDKTAAGENLRKVLTKYNYEVYLDSEPTNMRYSDLIENGLKNVIATFHKKKSDDVIFKGIRIKRVRINEDKT